VAGVKVIAGIALATLLAGCSRSPAERVEWPVMGTVAAVQARGGSPNEAARCVRAAFADVETLLDAHRRDSEISRLASLADDAVVASCSELVRPCYAAAIDIEKASGGAFSPRWRGPGTLDLGAIAKGFAVDLAADAVAAEKAGADVLLDLGGNVKAVRGEWLVGVKDPEGAGFAARVRLREGEALATSATYYRGGHIRDGRTGAVVTNGVASVTVLARSAMVADGLSTALFVLGPEEGREFVGRLPQSLAVTGGVSILWIMSDGRMIGGDRWLRD